MQVGLVGGTHDGGCGQSYPGWEVVTQWVQGPIGDGLDRGTDAQAFGMVFGNKGRGVGWRNRLVMCARELSHCRWLGIWGEMI